MEREITLRIVLESPPLGVDFGVQKGRGSTYETIQIQRSTGGDLTFEFDVILKGGAGGPVDFGGPIVQGPRGERFVYIDIGARAGQKGTPCSRRLKIPLDGIPARSVARTSSEAAVVVETRVSGTGKDGGPACGSVKDFAGWNELAR